MDRINGSFNITVGSLKSWCFYMIDFSSDVTYISVVPIGNDFLWYMMLVSLIFPPILNFVWLSLKIGKKKED